MPAIDETATDCLSIDPELLPESVREMAEVIGLEAALGVVRRFGGTRLWLPLVVEADHPLAREIGLAQAKRLGEYYRLESITVPSCKGAFRVLRNERITRRYRAGETAAVLAREYGLHERMIWQIVAGQKKAVSGTKADMRAGRIPDLFNDGGAGEQAK